MTLFLLCGTLKLSQIHRDYYIIVCPTLRELVQLEKERMAATSYVSTTFRPRLKEDKDCDIVIKEREVSTEALQRLAETPMEIVYLIFKFQVIVFLRQRVCACDPHPPWTK